MKIVGCDLHTRYQQIAMLDKEEETGGFSTGDVRELLPRQRKEGCFLLTSTFIEPHNATLSLPVDGRGRASLHWLLQRLDLLGWNSLG
jgi:hypothetical protein